MFIINYARNVKVAPKLAVNLYLYVMFLKM